MKPTTLRNIFHRLYFDLTDQLPQQSYQDSFYEENLTDEQIEYRLDKIKEARQATMDLFSDDRLKGAAEKHFKWEPKELARFVFDYIIRDFCSAHGLNPDENMKRDLFSDNKELSPDRRIKCGRKCRAYASFIEQWSPNVGQANYAAAGHRKKDEIKLG